MGPMRGMLFYYVLLGSMVLLMALRVARENVGMGVATFFFWPLAVIPLLTNWGQRGSDIRLHFAAALFATVMVIYKGNQAASQIALELSDQDIEMIRAQDPQTAATIERRQLAAMGVNVGVDDAPSVPNADSAVTTFATISMQPSGMSRRGPVPADVPSTLTRLPQAEDLEFAPAPAQIRKVPLNELHFRRGQIRLGRAYCNLRVPEHFRFISAQQLGLLAEIRGVTVDAQTLGWLVHERVDLNSRDFWFVDVQFDEIGHLSAPAATRAEAGPAGPAKLAVHRFDWDPTRAIVTWDIDANQAKDVMQAAKLLRHGALVYRVADLDANRQELGLRAARLMASRTEPESGWAHADYTGPDSGPALSEWVELRSNGAGDTAKAEVGEQPRRS